MAYEAEISRANPGCFLFLIDQSGSMAEEIADKPGGKTKAQGVADAINDLLYDLVIKCTRPDGVRDYFDVGVIGYGEKVGPAFTGILANRDLVPLSEVAKHQSRMGDRPLWFDPVAKGDTAMCAALKRAYEVLGGWVRRHPTSYPPIVINITDGDSKDGDPTEPAHHLASLSTKDGNVLLFNYHISSEKAKPILFPRDEKALPGFAPRLFLMSSTLPPRFREAAKDLGYDVVDDTRG
ncbi:MAG: VWA domain-containing protein, partial [Dehalococcoidia bacterium]|nr:VWA domain-containing protein [Dehalococcoidia bacterium]